MTWIRIVRRVDKERERLSRIEDKIPLYTRQISDKHREISNNNREIERMRVKITTINSQIMDLKKIKKPSHLSLNQIESQNNDLVKSLEQERARKQEAAQASSRVPLLKNAFQKISMSIKNLNSIIVRKEKIKSELLFEFAKFENIKKPTNKTLTNLKEERLGLEHNQKKIDSQISKLEERISNFVSIIQNKKCPICERIVDAEDFTGKKSHFTVEHEELKRSSKSYTDRIKAVDYLIEELAKFNEAK